MSIYDEKSQSRSQGGIASLSDPLWTVSGSNEEDSKDAEWQCFNILTSGCKVLPD